MTGSGTGPMGMRESLRRRAAMASVSEGGGGGPSDSPAAAVNVGTAPEERCRLNCVCSRGDAAASAARTELHRGHPVQVDE
jgi:hypothetical protein